jgi:hypothetical protein
VRTASVAAAPPAVALQMQCTRACPQAHTVWFWTANVWLNRLYAVLSSAVSLEIACRDSRYQRIDSCRPSHKPEQRATHPVTCTDHGLVGSLYLVVTGVKHWLDEGNGGVDVLLCCCYAGSG